MKDTRYESVFDAIANARMNSFKLKSKVAAKWIREQLLLIERAYTFEPTSALNVAKARKALEKCNEFFRCDDDNKAKLCHLCRRADESVQAALAATARNCDRPFRSVNEAIGAYVGERGDGPHLGYCDAIKWALAPAEGETK